MTSNKVMFEIYREAGYGRKYRVVYFTELNEHNKEAEINRALLIFCIQLAKCFQKLRHDNFLFLRRRQNFVVR